MWIHKPHTHTLPVTYTSMHPKAAMPAMLLTCVYTEAAHTCTLIFSHVYWGSQNSRVVMYAHWADTQAKHTCTQTHPSMYIGWAIGLDSHPPCVGGYPSHTATHISKGAPWGSLYSHVSIMCGWLSKPHSHTHIWRCTLGQPLQPCFHHGWQWQLISFLVL